MPDNNKKTPTPKSKRTIEERVEEHEDRIAYLEMQEAELVLVGEMEGRLKEVVEQVARNDRVDIALDRDNYSRLLKVEEQAHIHDEEGNVAELYNEPEDNEPDIERLAEVAHRANMGSSEDYPHPWADQPDFYQNVIRRIVRAILVELGENCDGACEFCSLNPDEKSDDCPEFEIVGGDH